MKKYIFMHKSEISHAIGVGIGFLNFYIFYFSLGVSLAISFPVAFTFGYLVGGVLDFLLDENLGKSEAQKISDAVNKFEKNG